MRGSPLEAAALAVATLLLGGQAFARDLEKAPVASALMPCPWKGSGFVRMPGSRSCIRVSGGVSAGTDFGGRARIGASGAPVVAGRLAIDNRTASDLGEVRTYVRIGNGRR
ncbi:porin [Methylobacterium sp. NEAU K]|uniref:porin n=1 Tax=Methylobacterium sp. NEAU K TaxID=3064946 RepID=UPI0027351C4C|nr:porin [Methylobacterium sp. NEAU K]MDP4004296.1 porin [Methylobacterium sp. NEAU K]